MNHLKRSRSARHHDHDKIVMIIIFGVPRKNFQAKIWRFKIQISKSFQEQSWSASPLVLWSWKWAVLHFFLVPQKLWSWRFYHDHDDVQTCFFLGVLNGSIYIKCTSNSSFSFWGYKYYSKISWRKSMKLSKQIKSNILAFNLKFNSFIQLLNSEFEWVGLGF